MTNHSEPVGVTGEAKITLRSAGELAEALPYLLGFRPEDCIVLVALHEGRFGGRVRLGIPDRPEDWPAVADLLARCLIGECVRRDGKPDSIIAFLCQDPAPARAGTGRLTMERLRPLAQLLRTACGALDVPVTEALCLSADHYWSYCCVRPDCCPPDGNPVTGPGTSVMAATAAYAGIQVRASEQEVKARLAPLVTALGPEQERALDAASMDLVPRMLSPHRRADVEAQTLDLARLCMRRLADASSAPDALEADLKDDELLAHDEAAVLILGLQDRETRDRAAEWMEGDEAACALRLWRALARRCVGDYCEHAAAPLTLAGWVAWSLGDTVEADVALEMALGADPDYVFARLLNEARSGGLDPEPVRRSLRGRRADHDEASDPLVDRGEGDAEAAGIREAVAAGIREAEDTGFREREVASITEGEAAGLTEGAAVGITEGEGGSGEQTSEPLVPGTKHVVDPGVSRAARGLEAALRRRGERRPGAGTRPGRAGTRAPRRPSGRRRIVHQRQRGEG
ncbi:DUF4192 domain-containing protein [Streptomyces xanthii]|uniref:DUF4192 domain-containing protein n=1 Tax=Streptomyces xanthii TaxID=2768069 RepID=A0A7H1B4N4_9ACTN|nr:DUF4192 domain-containing protein [Streptomyces xanthii]QNS03689.1 DUF4192 domain-containing protein [Streptomyces xanthii]